MTNASTNAPQIIILDGHHSHKNLPAITFARDHGIQLITLPPHCIHKMQPLNRAYFKSLKSCYNAAVDSWMVSHSGKRLKMVDVAAVFRKAYLRCATPDNAIQAFACCGFWPFDEHIFQNDFENLQVNEELSNSAPFASVNNHTPEEATQATASPTSVISDDRCQVATQPMPLPSSPTLTTSAEQTREGTDVLP